MTDLVVTDAKRKLLERLKRQGPMVATELASELGLTDMAVRQHLTALRGMGLVNASAASRAKEGPAGRGRPSASWSLTDLAHDLFPDHHAELAVDFIKATRSTLGEETLLRIVEARAHDQVDLYKSKVPAAGSLKQRVEALARQRTDEGYMAEVVQEKPGTYLLIEHHCPICDAAKCCQGLCAAELGVFRTTLGQEVRVERIEHVLAEGTRCVYRIEGC